jgi:7-cyano-7-deazaguanine synthase
VVFASLHWLLVQEKMYYLRDKGLSGNNDHERINGGTYLKAIVVLASGGLDSSTTMLRLANDGYKIYPLFINYGQDSAFMEQGSVTAIVEHLKHKGVNVADLHIFKIESIGAFHEKYRDAGRKGSFFPFRNLILASVGALYGYHNEIFEIGLGFVKDSFKDCTPDFQRKLADVLSESVPKQIFVHAPFINDRKSDILKYGDCHEFPYKLTYSCYEGRENHCGGCGGCKNRKAAFEEAQIKDPTSYEDQD